jgi:hypothetical protein
MKITIEEDEIQTSIKEYLGRIMTVAQGAQIEIDLKATRGDRGFTAIIDITPNQKGGYVLAETPRVVTQEKIVPTQVNSDYKLTHDEPAIEEPVKEDPPFDTYTVEAEPITQSDETQHELSETSAVTKTGEDASGVKKRSLFGGLKKPN